MLQMAEIVSKSTLVPSVLIKTHLITEVVVADRFRCTLETIVSHHHHHHHHHQFSWLTFFFKVLYGCFSVGEFDLKDVGIVWLLQRRWIWSEGCWNCMFDSASVKLIWRMFLSLQLQNNKKSEHGYISWDMLCRSDRGVPDKYRPHVAASYSIPLPWRHNDHDGVSNHQPHGCLLNRLFRRR